MNIIDKIALSQVPVVLFHEGHFLKAYNQSCYIIKQHVMPDLKLVTKKIKSINQIVVCGGFPVSTLDKWFPYASKTTFGYQINHQSWDLTAYSLWFKQQQQLNLLIDKSNLQPNVPLQSKTFTPHQWQFLTDWQMESSSADVNCHFIQHLKDYLGV